MEKQHIRILITRFFENNFSKESILKFQFWLTRTEDKELKEEVLNEIWESETAEADRLTLQGLEDMNRRIGKRDKTGSIPLYQHLLRIAAILALPVIGSLLTYCFISSEEKPISQVTEMTEYIVPDGDMKQLVLPDGSEVWLNAGSILLFSGNLSGTTRSLFLSGEARFHVKKDPERPFIVKTQYTQVEALGTTFNVKSYNDAGLTEVTLEEGLVRLDLNGKITASEMVRPNEQFIYDHRNGIIFKKQVDAELVGKWKEGYLVFQDSSFEEIIRAIERRFNVTVNYDIRKYGGGEYSIKYAPYENVSQVLSILETINPGLQWTFKDNAIEIK